MRRLWIGALALLVLGACKKKENTETAAPAAVSQTTEETTASYKYPVFTEQNVGDLLGEKDNDTLYVTNFFATWCVPCLAEIPHFKEEMDARAGEKVKFTFISVDGISDWDTKVPAFGDEFDINDHIVLFDMYSASKDFPHKYTQSWDGGAIPFTRITKGNKVEERLGSMSKEEMHSKLEALN